MIVYVLTDGQYDQEVAGVFATASAAMAERPDLTWAEHAEEDFPSGSWWGQNGLTVSRVYGFKLTDRKASHREDMSLPPGCLSTCDWRGGPIHAPGCPNAR